MNKRTLLGLIMLISTVVMFSMPPHSRIFDLINRGIVEVPLRSAYYGESVERDYTGTFKAVVLFAEFPDQPHQVQLSFFNDLLNSTGLDFGEKYPISTNVSSVKEYYLFESNETFQLDFDVYGWFEMPNDYDYYVGNSNGTGSYPNNSQKLVEDVIDAADSTVDFSLYDNDNNGTVDFLLVVHTGTGAEFSGAEGAIWSHMWSISPKFSDDVRISQYSMQPEYWLEPNDMTIGVYCHELGHLIFNLPDLYDVNKSSYGIGYWGLMGGGSWNDEMSVFGNDEISGYGGAPAELTAWSKLKIGWYEPYDLESDYQGTLEIDSREIYRYQNPNDPSQYMLYEFKESNLYNQWLPGSEGLLIYRCDDSKYSNTQPWIPEESLDYHYKVAIMQKDNQWSLEKKENRGDFTDLFYTSDVFNQFSKPSNLFYDSTYSLDLNQITIDDNKVIAIINEDGFDVLIQPLYGTGKIRTFLKATDSILPPIKDSQGFSIPVTKLLNHENAYYFDIESEASSSIYISNIPLSMYQ